MKEKSPMLKSTSGKFRSRVYMSVELLGRTP